MRAVATGRPVVTGSGPASSVPAFCRPDGGIATGIAVPLLVGGRAVAVVYADREGTAPDAVAVACGRRNRGPTRRPLPRSAHRAARRAGADLRRQGEHAGMIAAAASSSARRRARIVGLAAAVAIAVVLGRGAVAARGPAARRRPRPAADGARSGAGRAVRLLADAGRRHRRDQSELRDFARAVAVIDSSGDPRSVAPLLQSAALDTSPLAGHVRYYRGLVALRQDDFADRRSRLHRGRRPARPAPSPARRCCGWPRPTNSRAATTPRRRPTPARSPASRPIPIASRHKLAVSLERAGDVAGSVAAHRRVYFDFPLSPDADGLGRRARTARRPAMPTSKDGWPANAPAPTRCSPPGAGRLARTAYGRVVRSLGWRCASRGGGARRWHRRLPEAVPQRRRSAAPAGRRGPAPGRGPALPGAGRPRAGPDGRLRARRARAGGAVPDSPYAEEGLNALATSLVVGDDDAGGGRRLRPDGADGSRPAGSPSGRRGRPAGGLTASARWPTPCSSSRSAPPASRARTTVRRGSTGAPARRNSWATPPAPRPATPSPPPTTRTATTAGWRCGGWASRRWRRRFAGNPALRPTPPPTQAADRLAAVARPQRPGAGRDPVRPPHLGRFAGPGRDHRAGPAPRRPPAPRHQRHEARLSRSTSRPAASRCRPR